MNNIKCIIAGCMDHTLDNTFESANRIFDVNGISPTLNTCGGGGLETKILIKQPTKKGFIKCNIPGVFDGSYTDSKTRRGRVIEEGNITPTLTANGVENIMKIENDKTQYRIRKLTPLECFRLMGVSDEDANAMLNVNSKSQCYKQAGNSIVVDVMAEMFKQLF